MKIKILIIAIILHFVAACVSEKCPPQPPEYRPHISSEVAATFIRADDEINLRIPENIKAYSLGRRVDAGDKSLMHEGGLIYRVENDSSWNLEPGLPVKLPFSGTPSEELKDSDSALEAEMEVKANEQRRLYEYLKTVSKDAGGQMKALEDSAKISRQLLEQNKVLKAKLHSTDQHNQELTKDLAKLKTQLGSLLKFYQKKEEEKIKSRFRR